MSEEEKKAIEYLEEYKKYCDEQIKIINALDCDYYDEELDLYKNRTKQFTLVLNLVQKQQKEIENKDKIIKKIINKNKELLNKLKNRVNQVRKLEKYSLYKKEFSNLNNQLKKKDKIIDEMAEYIKKPYQVNICKGRMSIVNAIKQYFEKKVEEKEDSKCAKKKGE